MDSRIMQAAPGCSWRHIRHWPFRHSCRIKGCERKGKNGRCRLNECHMEVDGHGEPTGRCQEFKLRTLGRIR